MKNSDDIGARFDLRAEVYTGGVMRASGIVQCLSNVRRNPDRAQDVTIPFGAITNGILGPVPDTLSLKISTRMGTDPTGVTRCGTHVNSAGLRLYYDAPHRPARLGTAVLGETLTDRFLHSDGLPCRSRPDPFAALHFLDAVPPTSTKEKCRDSAALKWNGGNAWRDIGTWSMPLP